MRQPPSSSAPRPSQSSANHPRPRRARPPGGGAAPPERCEVRQGRAGNGRGEAASLSKNGSEEPAMPQSTAAPRAVLDPTIVPLRPGAYPPPYDAVVAGREKQALGD